MNEKPEFKLPKTLGAAADELYAVRQARLKLVKEVEAKQRHETFLSEYLIEQLPVSEAEGVTGKVAKATVLRSEVPQVEDWDRFYKYILKSKDFSLLQRRVGVEAVRERWANDKAVPGVTVFHAKKISVTKR